jgi:peptide/nickel transport system permease protein
LKKGWASVFAIPRARPLAVLAALILGLVLVAALFADLIATHDPLAQSVSDRLKPPGPGHYFGTDGFGRDVFSRMIFASRASLSVGFIAVGAAALAGVTIGAASAYRAGSFDLIIQRVIDVLLGFPFLVLAVIVIVALGPSSTSVAAAIALVLVPKTARVARASVLSVKSELYVAAAEIIGAGPWTVIRRHLLPNSLSPVLSQITGYFGTALVAETTLSFLGLGVPPPFPSWGRMLQEGARQYFEAAPWVTLFPGLAVSLTVLSFAILGDALRDLLDPRQRALIGKGAKQGIRRPRPPRDSGAGRIRVASHHKQS